MMLQRPAVMTAMALVLCCLGIVLHAQDGFGILYEDDFSADIGRWTTSATDNGLRIIENGQLRITDYEGVGTTGSYLDRNLIFSDIEIEFDTTLLSGNDRGWHVVLLRYLDSDNYYGFAFTAAGKVYGYILLNGERTVWQPNSNFPAIRTGFGQVNHMHASVIGDVLRFAINGEVVAQIEQPGLTEGRVGLSVSAPSGDHANGETVVAFDNVVIRGPLASAVPPRILVDSDFEQRLHALVEPGTIRAFEDENGDGQPDAYSYLMPREEPIPGIELRQVIGVDVTDQTGAMVLNFINTTGEAQQFLYTVAIPKAFAEHVNDLTIYPPPMRIIDPDPVILLGISSDPEEAASTVITVDSVRDGGSDLNDLADMFQGFQYERVRQFCLQAERDGNRIRCFMNVAEHFPNHVTEADCDDVANTLDAMGRSDRDDLFLTCRAILTRDIWDCSRIEHVRDRSTCETTLAEAMERRCQFLTDEAEALCQQEAAAALRGSDASAAHTPTPPSADITASLAGTWQYADADGLAYSVSVTIADGGTRITVDHQGVFSETFSRVAEGQYRFERAAQGDEIYGTTSTLTVVSPNQIAYVTVIGPTTINATLRR